MDKKQLTILVIVGVILFVLGTALGIAAVKAGPQKVKVEAVNRLSSKVISSITSYGQVAKIEGRNITLNYLGDNLLISIADSARVYSLTTSTTGNIQKTVEFSAIKVGDNVNVVMKVLPSGQIEGSSVIIFPAK